MSEKPPDFTKPYSTVDLVIFTVRDDALSVLLVQRANAPDEPYPLRWALPGGYIDVDRDFDLLDCAKRKLKEKTSLVSPYLEQLGSFGDRERDPRGWSITQVYFALVPSSEIRLQAGANAIDARWFEIGSGETKVRERLAFDHERILTAAIERLRSKVEYTSLPAYLLPEEFTLSELQHIFEIVLARRLDKSGFRTRVLDAGLITKVPRVRRATNRPAQLYRLKDRSAPLVFPRTLGAKN
ncbi:MAG: NUDIX hydrolase [Deltaproteobacteria bacterium]|nr:NUDIX hydrolase [Deltaproteobacteria bacterium]